MTFEEYKSYFSDIIDKDQDKQVAPYDNPMYYDYTKLNWSRMKRWLKTGKLSSEVLEAVKKINTPQNWIIITEPWCGDASHNVPFMEMIAKENPLISISYELRDSEPNRINEYLTNGGKSIPKLIIRDTEGVDLATWVQDQKKLRLFITTLCKIMPHLMMSKSKCKTGIMKIKELIYKRNLQNYS